VSPPGRFPAPRAAFRRPRRRRLVSWASFWSAPGSLSLRIGSPERTLSRKGGQRPRCAIADGRPLTTDPGLLDLGPSRPPSRRRPFARERRMAPSTSVAANGTRIISGSPTAPGISAARERTGQCEISLSAALTARPRGDALAGSS
jgi:hypothetical protein